MHEVTRVFQVHLVPQETAELRRLAPVWLAQLESPAPPVSEAQAVIQVLLVYVATPVLQVDTDSPVSQVNLAPQALQVDGVLLVPLARMLYSCHKLVPLVLLVVMDLAVLLVAEVRTASPEEMGTPVLQVPRVRTVSAVDLVDVVKTVSQVPRAHEVLQALHEAIPVLMVNRVMPVELEAQVVEVDQELMELQVPPAKSSVEMLAQKVTGVIPALTLAQVQLDSLAHQVQMVPPAALAVQVQLAIQVVRAQSVQQAMMVRAVPTEPQADEAKTVHQA